MILLEPENPLIRDLLSKHFVKPISQDQTLTDFDGVRYHVESSKAGPLTLSMSINCWRELVSYGAEDILKREYGSYLQGEVETGYNVTLLFTPDAIPQDEREWCLIQQMSERLILLT
jgi:actin related protein 2/3 complex subunit 2